MEKQYRIINWQDMYVLPGQETAVTEKLSQTGWEPMPTQTEKGLLIAPRPKEYMAQTEEQIQILRAIAPHLQEGHMILEVTHKNYEKTWLHLIYENRAVHEVETPVQQWNV